MSYFLGDPFSYGYLMLRFFLLSWASVPLEFLNLLYLKLGRYRDMTLLFDPSNMKIMITNNKRFTYLLSYEWIPLLQTIRSFYEPHQSMKIDASI